MGPEGERQDEGCQRSADERPGAVTSPAGIGAVAEAANEGGVPEAGEEHQQGHRRFDDVGLVGHALVRHQADAARAHDHGGLARMGPALVGGVGAHCQRQRIGPANWTAVPGVFGGIQRQLSGTLDAADWLDELDKMIDKFIRLSHIEGLCGKPDVAAGRLQTGYTHGLTNPVNGTLIWQSGSRNWKNPPTVRHRESPSSDGGVYEQYEPKQIKTLVRLGTLQTF